jgi:hypothetical protein
VRLVEARNTSVRETHRNPASEEQTHTLQT